MTKPNLETLKQARQLVQAVTPLQGDCGLVCGGRCCQPGGEDAPLGMVLFPGEEQLLSACPGYEFSQANWRLGDALATLVACSGHCRREMRPLACRIFPLAIYLDEAMHLKLILDPAARFICPLCASGLGGLQTAFRQAVAACAKRLVQDPVQRDFIYALSRRMDQLRQDPFYRLAP